MNPKVIHAQRVTGGTRERLDNRFVRGRWISWRSAELPAVVTPKWSQLHFVVSPKIASLKSPSSKLCAACAIALL